jgi:Homing endonuclease associated repeat
MAHATRQSRRTRDAYCPHCHLLIERRVPSGWPPEPLRCPHCRLLVGAGRSKPTPAAEPGARGSAAGVFAQEAKRGGGDRIASAEEVCRAIRQVADELGSRPERLLMVDYQQRVTRDDSLPSLSEVFGAFGSWKRARRAAGYT